MNDPRYIVLNENTLGYVDAHRPDIMGILSGSVLKGGHSWLEGYVYLSPSDTARDAVAADFQEYRVVPPPAFAG